MSKLGRPAKSRIILSSAVLVTCLTVATGCVGIGGERIPLTHDPLATSSQRAGGHLVLQSPARDQRSDTSRVGHATVTLFAIPSGNVQTQDPVVEAVIDPVQDALAAAGYRVSKSSEEAGEAREPSVAITIQNFSFRNYNWLWPIVPTWGSIELGLQLRDTDGEVVYEQDFKSSGQSFCLLGKCAFSAATRRAMNGVLEQIVEASLTDEFYSALREVSTPTEVGSVSAAAPVHGLE